MVMLTGLVEKLERDKKKKKNIVTDNVVETSLLEQPE